MTGLPECFMKKQHMYHINKSQLIKITDPTPSPTSALKKDTLILEFSVIVNSQAAVTTAESFNKFADGLLPCLLDSYALKLVKLVVVDNFFHLLKQPIYQWTSKENL